jgi:hypothetical protein
MSFFFEEEKSTNALLEPKEHFYEKKESEPLLIGLERRKQLKEKIDKFREEELTSDSYLENYKASRQSFDKSNSEVSEYRNIDNAWSEITDIMNKNNVQFDNPIPDQDLQNTEFGLPEGYETRQERVNRSLITLQEEQDKNPNLKSELEGKSLNNLDAILKKISVDAKDSETYANELFENTNFSGKVGNIAGNAVSYLREPSVFLTLPIGFAYGFGKTALQTFLKTAYYEGVLAAGSETSRQLNVQPYREKLGFEGTGFEEGAKQVAYVSFFAAGIGGALNTGVYGLSKLFSKSTPEQKIQTIGKVQNTIENLNEEQTLKIYKEDFPEELKTKETDAAAEFLENRIFDEKQNPMVDNVRSSRHP